MNVRELQDALALIEKTYVAGGAKSQAKEVKALLNSMDGHADISVDEFVDLIEKGLANDGPADLIEVVTAGLFSAGTDSGQFQRHLDQIRVDKRVGLSEASVIANRYKNQLSGGQYVFKFKSKKEAFDFIYDTFLGRALGESKMKAIDALHRQAS
jgi:hypothetical protein